MAVSLIILEIVSLPIRCAQPSDCCESRDARERSVTANLSFHTNCLLKVGVLLLYNRLKQLSRVVECI